MKQSIRYSNGSDQLPSPDIAHAAITQLDGFPPSTSQTQVTPFAIPAPLQIQEALVREAKNFEAQYGLVEICEFVSRNTSPGEPVSYIDSYRAVIRGNSWPYPQTSEISHQEFLEDFNSHHVRYAREAAYFFGALSDGVGNEGALRDLHHRAVLSEMYRGQVGKRSKQGLDALLNRNLTHLERILDRHPEAGPPHDLLDMVAGTMEPPYMSAESEFVSVMREFSLSGAPIPSLKNLPSISDATDGLVPRILREFCRYSVEDFSTKFTALQRSNALTRTDSGAATAEARKVALDHAEDVLDRQDRADAARFRTLVSQIDELNFLNASLEVKFSFKGAPGLFHHLIFERVRRRTKSSSIFERQFELAFTATTN